MQALGLAAVGAFTFSASFLVLWLMKVTVGIRTEPEVETLGLDVSEHGMWGYPEFYIPVPGGYGTEHHGHRTVTTPKEPPSAPAPEPASAPGYRDPRSARTTLVAGARERRSAASRPYLSS